MESPKVQDSKLDQHVQLVEEAKRIQQSTTPAATVLAPVSPSSPSAMPVQNVIIQENIVNESYGSGRYLYSVFHTIMSLIAIYLSFRCNGGFDAGAFLMACCCPYIYIIYVLATKGTCGVLESRVPQYRL